MRFAWLSSHGCRSPVGESSDLRAVAAATTVWLAFDGLLPTQDAQDVLAANRGVWVPTAAVEDARLQSPGPPGPARL